MKHGNMPYHLYVLVPNTLLTNGVNSGYTKGIWWGVYCRLGQHLMSHVLLESGANWTGIHVKDLIVDDGKSKSLENIKFYNIPEQPLFPWAAMGDEVEVGRAAHPAEQLSKLVTRWRWCCHPPQNPSISFTRSSNLFSKSCSVHQEMQFGRAAQVYASICRAWSG